VAERKGLEVFFKRTTSNLLIQAEGDGMIKTHNDFSFEGSAVAEGFDEVILTPAFEYSDTRFSKKFVFP
jgi:hypothetical protein